MAIDHQDRQSGGQKRNHQIVLDEEHQDEVFEYFREEAETESVEDALNALGEDEYSEEEIRLMRIRFISEMGN